MTLTHILHGSSDRLIRRSVENVADLGAYRQAAHERARANEDPLDAAIRLCDEAIALLPQHLPAKPAEAPAVDLATVIAFRPRPAES
jgi:hypothetical protein